MYYVKHDSRRSLSTRRIILMIISVLICVMLAAANNQIRKIMNAAAQTQLQNRFSEALASTVEEMLADQYSFDLSDINTSDTGDVIALQTNTAAINRIKSRVSMILPEKLGEMEQYPIELTTGSLTGLELLAGIGPRIELRFELRSGINTDIASEFIEAGINQTLHRINCVVTADYYIILPGHKFEATISSKIPLSESVIVGRVPDAYTYVVGDENDTVGRIFDYGHLEP